MTSDRTDDAGTVVVLDFETTGLSPGCGDRAIEIGAVRLERGEIVASFQSLMNPGQRISRFIESYTGITNSMLADAPPIAQVMDDFVNFAEDSDMVAHNASFDRRFLVAELRRISRELVGEFVCSMLVARRIYQNAPNHKLATLVDFAQIPRKAAFHRALSDAEMTARLWTGMVREISATHRLPCVPFSLMRQISRKPRSSVQKFLRAWAAKQRRIRR